MATYDERPDGRGQFGLRTGRYISPLPLITRACFYPRLRASGMRLHGSGGHVGVVNLADYGPLAFNFQQVEKVGETET